MNLELIIETMREKGITIEQMVELSAVPKSTLVRILNGTTENPGIQTMSDIAVALGLSLNDIAGIDYEKLHDAPVQVVHHSNNSKIELMYKTMIHERDQRIKKLTIAVTILVAYQMLRWMLDVSNPQLGWIRLEDANVAYVSIFLLVLFALVIGALIFYLAKLSRQSKEHHKE